MRASIAVLAATLASANAWFAISPITDGKIGLFSLNDGELAGLTACSPRGMTYGCAHNACALFMLAMRASAFAIH
jgi:ammonia channel protein AmtB